MNGVVVDPAVMGGVPCVRGTRVPVVTITGVLAENMSIEAVLEHYPQLTVEDVHACQAFLDHLTRGRSGHAGTGIDPPRGGVPTGLAGPRPAEAPREIGAGLGRPAR